MNLISAEGISKSYSEKPLFNNISLGINEGDKIGLIGVNGTGKSTLLKVIAGIESIDEGRIIRSSNLQVEFLAQSQNFDNEATVIAQIFNGESPIMKLVREYEEALQQQDISSEKIVELSHKMDAMNGWNIESEAKTVLTKLGVSDFNAKVGTLSGGQRKRIALAAALINPSDLLILDEPTNHLDNDTIDWLEQYLNKRKGALIMITHDRYFLDRVVNEIIEIDKGYLYTYKGNYSDFLEKKLEREDIQAANEKKRQSLYKKELAWIRRGAKARTTKQKARIDRFEKLGEQKVELNSERLEITAATSRLGKKVIELKNINMCFGDKTLIEDFSYIVLRNDRIGIVGPNGSGKSTLVNILSRRQKASNGEVIVGETVRIGVFSQETYHIDDNLRVIEYIREGAEFLTTGEGEKISASQMLEKFLFPPAQQWTLIAKLSGGEKRRLYLLRVLMEAPNVLILDEPTNDLDIETLTVLEDYLEGFPGAVISVSHDRYFLDRIAEKIFSFEGHCNIVQYTGNYSDFKDEYENKKLQEESNVNKYVDKSVDIVDKNNEIVDKRKDKPLKFSYKEQKEYDEIDMLIADIEQKIEEAEEKISRAATDYAKLQQLLTEKEELEAKLEEKMERWVYLNELSEKIASSKVK